MKTKFYLSIAVFFVIGIFSSFGQFGTVTSFYKISSLTTGFTSALTDGTGFGQAVTSIGDINKDGVCDFASGNPEDDEGGSNRGSVFIMLMNSNGSVKSYHKISSLTDMSGMLDNDDWFGFGLTCIGDFDKDGVVDIVVGAPNDGDGGTMRGAFYLICLNSDGTVKSVKKNNTTTGTLLTSVTNYTRFACSVDTIGDLDQDGITDLIIGGPCYRISGLGCGAAYVVFMNSNGSIKKSQLLTVGNGGYTGTVNVNDYWGVGMAGIGDLDKDGIPDMAIGSREDDDGGPNRGAIWIFYMNRNGTIKAQQKVSSLYGNFTGALTDNDYFGESIANIGDLDEDGVVDLAVGSPDISGGVQRGKIFILFMKANGTVKSWVKIGNGSGGFTGTINYLDNFGIDVAGYSDYNHDGVKDILVGSRFDYDGGTDRGAVYILLLKGKIAHIYTNESTTFCQGIGVNLYADSNSGFSFKWLLNGAPITGATKPVYHAISPGKYRAIITYNSQIDTSSELILTMKLVPTANISTTDLTTFCIGKTAKLKADSLNGYTFQWLKNNIVVSGSTNKSIAVNSSGDFRVLVSNGFCSDTSKSIKVTVNPLPVVNVYTIDPTTFCQGQNASLQADSFANYTFNWHKNGISISGGTKSNYFAKTTGDYDCIISNGMCADTSQIISIFVNPKPLKPYVSRIGKNLYSSITNGNQWYNSTGLIPGANDSFYKPPVNGTYFTIVTSLKGCSSDTSNIMTFISGISESVFDAFIKLYPNPNNGSFIIINNYSSEIRIKITEIAGKVINEFSMKQDEIINMSISGLNPGVYFIKTEIGENIAIKKLIIY